MQEVLSVGKDGFGGKASKNTFFLITTNSSPHKTSQKAFLRSIYVSCFVIGGTHDPILSAKTNEHL